MPKKVKQTEQEAYKKKLMSFRPSIKAKRKKKVKPDFYWAPEIR